MKKISSLARMGLAHRAFGNPIPQAAYDLIESTEKCVEDFNPKIRVNIPAPIANIGLRSPLEVEDMWRDKMKAALRVAGVEFNDEN